MFPVPIAHTIDVGKSDMAGDAENEAVIVDLKVVGIVGIEAVGVVGVNTVGIGTCVSQARVDEGMNDQEGRIGVGWSE